MNTRTANIFKWQQDFQKAPLIYYTVGYFEGQQEDTGNFYDSKEAAQIEVDKYPARRLKICCANIHNIDLSKRRWEGYKE